MNKNMGYFHLTEFDCPQIRLYEDGTFYDEIKQTIISIPKNDGRIFCYSPIQNKNIRLSYLKVRNYYFNSPFSSLSRIFFTRRSLKFMNMSRYIVDDIGRVFSLIHMIYLKATLDSKGYPTVNISDDKNELGQYRVHQLIALAFIPNPFKQKIVNHKNGIKTDNRVANLEWCSIYENNVHAIKNNLVNRTINDEETVYAICRLLQQGYSNSKIAYRLNISPELVRSIKKGAHRHISQFYDFKRTAAFPYIRRLEEQN